MFIEPQHRLGCGRARIEADDDVVEKTLRRVHPPISDGAGKLEFSYSAVGATANQLPAGFVVDRTRIKLGEGELVFQAAKAALQRWRQFDLGWMEAWPPQTPIQTGEVVAIVARAIGLWTLNACKIVYVVDESGPISRLAWLVARCPIMRGEARSDS